MTLDKIISNRVKGWSDAAHLREEILSWFKEQLPSVEELTDFMEGKYDVTDDYREASEGLAKEIHALILTNLEKEK